MDSEAQNSLVPRPTAAWPERPDADSVAQIREDIREQIGEIRESRGRASGVIGVAALAFALLLLRTSPTPLPVAIVLFCACAALIAAIVLATVVQAPAPETSIGVFDRSWDNDLLIDTLETLRRSARRRSRTLFAAYICLGSGSVLLGAGVVLGMASSL